MYELYSFGVKRALLIPYEVSLVWRWQTSPYAAACVFSLFLLFYLSTYYYLLTTILMAIHETVLPKIKSGATIRVIETVKEGNKTRETRFEGLVIARKHGTEAGASFTVRTTMSGEALEKLYPINCPSISKVEILTSPKKVSRSKIYYVRDISRRELRRKTAVAAEKTAKSDKKLVAVK
jgi:large subunit ribosomal protein L19